MYLDHFGLNQPPFKITPNTGFFYTGGNRGEILDALLYAVTHGEGIVKVSGEIGSGKTMLCRMLECLLPENVEAIYLANPSLNRDEVFYVIAGELGLATEGQRASETLHQIQDYLIEKHSAGKQVVLLVEEAQAMPLDTLEEIRLLSNLETAHHKLLQIVLFGQPELNESLALPRMRQLKERITHSFSIPPLSRKDTPEYLMFRMRAAGYRGPQIFDAGAAKLIAAASRGITRRINILADKALLAAFSENTHDIRLRQVKAAIADSEFYVAAPSYPPLKRIGFAVMLVSLGIGLGAGGQYYANIPSTPAAPMPALAAQPAPRPAVVEAAQAEPAPAPKPASPAQPANETTPPTNAKPAAAASQPAPQEKPAQATPAAPPSQQYKPAAYDSARTSARSGPENPQGATAPTPTLFQQRLEATRAWLASEDSGHYTIQLMLITESKTSPQITQTLNKIKKEIGLRDIYIYPASTGGTNKHQFSVTLGSFSSWEQAIAAIAKLPANYKASHPILRTVKGIKDEIELQQH
ncbi:MAG TPA: AAA family ATPase [Sulfuricella sp.]|nr:AAA family ATPase [Sulfuricella sp.]